MQEYKMPVREENSNKGTFGKVLNFAGSKNYIGAAYLSTISPLKVGAGFVALASEKDIIKSVSALLAEAIYISPKQGLKDINNYSVVLIGCGLGNNKRLFQNVINSITTPPPSPLPQGAGEHASMVIDADGLNILSKLKLKLPKNTIITPHPLEAARLLGVELEDILQDLEGSAKKLSEKYSCVAILKTHRTIICDNENYFVNQHGNSALAKAGSGDVLAGIISGLLAQGMNPFEAAKLGVYLHSRAGEIASEELSLYSVLASDLPNYLHRAINEIT